MFPCFTCCQAIAQAGIIRVVTWDHEYWKNDPLDGDHQGKRYVLRQSNISVHAPNHPDFRTRPPTLRPPVKARPALPQEPALEAEVTNK